MSLCFDGINPGHSVKVVSAEFFTGKLSFLPLQLINKLEGGVLRLSGCSVFPVLNFCLLVFAAISRPRL